MIYVNNKQKIKKLSNLNNYCVVIDFDRTITTKESEPSLGVIPKYIGGELLEKRTKIFEYYRPLELNYTIDKEEKKKIMKEWANKTFTLLSKYVSEEVIDKSTDNCNMHLRKGAKEFLEKMHKDNIPVIIMSAGMGNIIKAFLEKQNVLFDNISIVSNFFEFKDNYANIDIQNLISTSNKDYSNIPINLRENLQGKEKILLFGDIVEDIKMINSNQLFKTITVGFLDENVENNLKTFNENFDIVVTGNDDFITINNYIN